MILWFLIFIFPVTDPAPPFQDGERVGKTRLTFTSTRVALRLPGVSPSTKRQKYRPKDRHFGLSSDFLLDVVTK